MNRQQQEEAFEAARLAALVGSSLKVVDQLGDGSGMPANRIDINAFAAKARGQNIRQQGGFTPVDPFQKKAMEDAIREAMMVPDAPQSYVPPAANISSQMIPMPSVSAPISHNNAIVTNDALKNIEEKVEKIGNTLDSLLVLIQTTLNQNE
jgi:hypothetical protein